MQLSREDIGLQILEQEFGNEIDNVNNQPSVLNTVEKRSIGRQIRNPMGPNGLNPVGSGNQITK